MALKLITRKDAELRNDELGIRLRLGHVMPEHIAELQGLMRTSHEPAGAICIYGLRHCVSELHVRDESGVQSMDARSLSYAIDPREPDNRPFMLGVAALLTEELIVSEAVRKKSDGQPSPSSGKSAA